MSNSSSSPCTSTALEAEQLKQQGNECFQKHQYQESIHFYTQSLDIAQNSAVYSNRCFAYLKLEKYEEARKDAEESILLDKSNLKAYYRRGLALIGLKKDAEAVDCLQQCLAIRHDPAINDLIEEIKPSANKFSSLTVLRPPYNLFQLGLADGSGEIDLKDWIDLAWRLRYCHTPIDQVLFHGIKIDDTVIKFLRKVDPACFVNNALALNSVHMEMAADMGWMDELFGDTGIFKPAIMQLNGIRGIDSKFLCETLITLKSFQLAKKIVLLDFIQLPGMSRDPEAAAAACFKIDTGTLIAWLNNRFENSVPASKASARIFNIQAELIEDRLEDVIDKMFENFLSDNQPASFSLQVHRPADSIYDEENGWPSSQITGEKQKIGKSAIHPKTGEVMRVCLLSVHNYGYADDEKADDSSNQGEMSCAGDDLYVERFSGKDEDSHWAKAYQNTKAVEDKRNQEGKEAKKVLPIVLGV